MWAESHSKERPPGCRNPRQGCERPRAWPAPSLPSWGKGGPQGAGDLPKVTQETVAEASRSLRVSGADPPSPRAPAPPIGSSACGGAPPPPCQSVSRSVWASRRAQPCTPHPAWGAAQGEAGRSQRPARAPRPPPTEGGSACARGPPAGARESPAAASPLSELRKSPAGRRLQPALQDEEAPGSSSPQGGARGRGPRGRGAAAARLPAPLEDWRAPLVCPARARARARGTAAGREGRGLGRAGRGGLPRGGGTQGDGDPGSLGRFCEQVSGAAGDAR